MDIMGLRTFSSLLVLAFLVQFGSGQQQQQHPPPGPLASRTPTLDIVPDALAESTCLGTDPCVPDCLNCAANEKVPNPEDCRTYYMCIDGAASDNYYPLPYDCGDGQVYNFTEHDCVTGDTCEPCDPGPLECSYECPAATTDSPTGAATTADVPVYIPHPNSCNNYYKCDAGEIIESLTCGFEAPFFDGEECQTDETRCCHCHPYCYSEGELSLFIPDPLDCRGYYVCTAFNEGSTPTIHGICPDGKYFNSSIQDCSATALCVTQCTNVVGVDGCIDPFTCLEEGYFAKCPLAQECTPEYYHCTGPTGLYQEAASCSNGEVYNPTTHTCVSVDNCP